MKLVKNKKILTGIVLLMVLLLSALFLIILTRKQQNFVVVIEDGVVNFKNAASDSYSNITGEESEFKSGTFIKTDENGFAQIYLPDNSIISLDSSTEVQVMIETAGITIDQLVGNTWHRVWELTDDKTYDVKTPNTIASVRGTIFSVDVNPDENSSVVLVEENTVAVEQCESEKLMLKEGKIVQVNKSGTQCDSSDSDTFAELKETPWYKKNKLKDSVFIDLRAKKIKNRKEFKKQFIAKLKENPEYLELLKNKFPGDIYNQFGPFIQVTAPDLELPENIYRTSESRATVEGRTNIVNNVSINGEVVENLRGKFKRTLDLVDGENKVIIKVENKITKRIKERTITIIKGTGQGILGEITTNQPTNNTPTGSTTGIVAPKLNPAPAPQPTPTPTPEPVSAIYLSGSLASYGINLNWISQNLKYGEGFLILGSTSPGVNQQNASFSIWVPGTSTNYAWGIQDSQVYYLVVCEAVSQLCLTYSNEVSVKAPDPAVVIEPPTRSLKGL